MGEVCLNSLSRGAAVCSVILILSSYLVGCFDARPKSLGANASTATAAKVGGTSTTSNNYDSQCTVFVNNSRDYSTCISCKNSLGTSDITRIAECVHSNNTATGGTCLGLRCSENQTPDFTSCVCKDATPATTIGSPPGFDDQLTPYMEPGFFIGDRFCSPPENATSTSYYENCLRASGGSSPNLALPKHTTQTPINVHQDVGYIRWDLGMDASQYSPSVPLTVLRSFKGSNSTLSGNVSMFFQLKPNTQLGMSNGTTVSWMDCVEHFSGYLSGATTYYSTQNRCDPRSIGAMAAPNPRSVAFTLYSASSSSISGRAVLERISMNGSAANSNLTTLSTSDNPVLNMTSSGSDTSANFGLAKLNNGAVAWPSSANTGLFSNIGTYKYTWGPLGVRRPSGSSDIASGVVSGRIALNTNLGYTPVSAVDSTAFSPDAINGSLTSRVCYDTGVTSPASPCAVTAVYRSSGGGVLYQTFTPQFQNSNHASPIGTLPSGITAVSTPKVIEDKSQLIPNIQTRPARLRTFVRASDGSIYMSRGENNSWSAWVSLGRPFVAANAAVANDGSSGPFSFLNRVYWPYTNIFAQAVDPDLPDPYVGGANDGISIAGEPVVVTWLNQADILATGSTPHRQVIAIFVRVSQLNSSTGAFGAYHNAVFYTFGVSRSETAATSVTTLDLDNLANWSRWMPVRRDAAPLRIQGNPLVLISDLIGGASTGAPIVYLFGTSNTSLHPPIAPNNSDLTHTAIADNWYNYTRTIRRTSLDFSTYVTAGTLLSTITAPLNWRTFDDYTVGDAVVEYGINSDLTAAPLVTVAGARSGYIRLFAMTISAHSAPTGSAKSPGTYTKTIHSFNYQFTAPGTSGLTQTCSRAYTFASSGTQRFVGTPWPINIGYENTARSYATSFLNAYVDPSNGRESTGYPLLLFGRGLCRSARSCDPVNPSVAYHASRETEDATDACPTAASTAIYYAGDVSAAADISTYPLLPQYITSDVIPVYSSALDEASNDVPIYLFTRGQDGRVVHGIWDSRNSGATGSPYFRFFTRGGFTN